MKKLILLLTAALAVLAMQLLSIGQAQVEPTVHPVLLTGERRSWTQAARISANQTLTAQVSQTRHAERREWLSRGATQAATSLGNLGEVVDAAAGPGGPAEPGGPIGPVYTVGEGLFDIDAGATALHQMVDSPAAAPAFRSICDLPPPRSPAEVVACDLYKAAYRLRHGNPCRHNDEGEAVCLH